MKMMTDPKFALAIFFLSRGLSLAGAVANDPGNKTPVNRRMVLAIMAIKALAKRYTFAGDHFIIAGFSGGGTIQQAYGDPGYVT